MSDSFGKIPEHLRHKKSKAYSADKERLLRLVKKCKKTEAEQYIVGTATIYKYKHIAQ